MNLDDFLSGEPENLEDILNGFENLEDGFEGEGYGLDEHLQRHESWDPDLSDLES